MTRWSRTLVVTLAFGLAAAALVSAHMAYSKSMPAKDATVAESPEQLQVWFTQDPEPAVSRLSLEGPGGEIAIGETRVGEEKSLVAAVSGPLEPGAYTVSWRSAGDDGHVQRGDFSFAVRTAN